LTAGPKKSISIEIETLGNENALGFSLMFDPNKLTFVSAEKSEEVKSGALNVNKLEAVKGRLGIALALPAGTSFGAGKHQVVILNFEALGDASEGIWVSFTDLPIAREVIDVNANRVKTRYQEPTPLGLNTIGQAQWSLAPQFLDFLNPGANVAGLNNWIGQIIQCPLGNWQVCWPGLRNEPVPFTPHNSLMSDDVSGLTRSLQTPF
jgi:hypothetical protein